MTHSLHRQGSIESLSCDYPILTITAVGINEQGSAGKKKEIFDILIKHNPCNLSQDKTGNVFQYSAEELRNGINDKTSVMAVFTDLEDLRSALIELKEKDLGVSVVVSGLIEPIKTMCSEIGIECHSINLSGGIMGRLDRLPPQGVVEITTMCGHGLISAELVGEMVDQIRKGRRTRKDAANHLASLCHCGIFNPKRAEELLSALIDSQVL